MVLTGESEVFAENPVPVPLHHHQYLVNCPGSELVSPMVTDRCKFLYFCGGCYIVCCSEMEALCCEGTLS